MRLAGFIGKQKKPYLMKMWKCDFKKYVVFLQLYWIISKSHKSGRGLPLFELIIIWLYIQKDWEFHFFVCYLGLSMMEGRTNDDLCWCLAVVSHAYLSLV